MCIQIKNISYSHPDKEVLFQDIRFSLERGKKAALIGKNGSGKSTLLQVISGKLQATSGEIAASSTPYYIPQHLGQFDELTIAQALQVDKKLDALKAIVSGDASEENFNTLNDEWDIEERVSSALAFWGIGHFEPERKLSLLSGGEKTKVFLSGILVHSPSVILMDEPTNHLDYSSREILYEFILKTNATLLIVSHDRKLLNHLDFTFELDKSGITCYGGNYEFYKAEKEKELGALHDKLEEKEKQLRLARKTAREVAERRQKLDAKGEKKSIKEGVPRILMKTLKNNAEKSSARLNDIHVEKQKEISSDLSNIRSSLPDISQMKVNFNSSTLHNGKMLVTIKDLCFTYGDKNLWSQPLNLHINSGDRLSIEGANGIGKTTLIKLIVGKLAPTSGEIISTDLKYIYIDQEYSIINNGLSIYEQSQQFNSSNLQEHEIKLRLNRFLFPSDTWDKPCNKLSGGEKMRLTLCCLMISNSTPDLFILDEPTNNLDIRNIEILTATIRDYEGTVLVISHDSYFKEEINIRKQIKLL